MAERPANALPVANAASPAGPVVPGQPGAPGDSPASDAEAEAFNLQEMFWSVDAPSWLVSLVVHLALTLLLALCISTEDEGPRKIRLHASFEEGVDVDLGSDPGQDSLGGEPLDTIEIGLNDVGDSTTPTPIFFNAVATGKGEQYAVGLPGLPKGVLDDGAGLESAGGLEGRIGDGRLKMAYGEGATEESENAMRRGLDWLRAHQRADGGWRFNLQGATSCQCRHAGSASSTTAATGLALMAYLGAGQTHSDGEYSHVVRKGIYYLLDRLQATRHGADLQEGTMYGQGIASIALCEAYALSNDAALKPWAQGAVDFILNAQDPRGGGWRYVPNEPGDTSMHGWQLMALRSGEMGYLQVPPTAFRLASHFLDTVEKQRPMGYGYQTPDDGSNATIAIGALCRMYEGWPRSDSRLYQLVRRLAEIGPSSDDMYYNYYATQVLHHWGGSEWTVWNERMREHLIRTQAREGCESGSWQFNGNQGKVGGRLYNTAMAVMTLEVYYRHLPLYRVPAMRKN